jgi:hypothetical protein
MFKVPITFVLMVCTENRGLHQLRNISEAVHAYLHGLELAAVAESRTDSAQRKLTTDGNQIARAIEKGALSWPSSSAETMSPEQNGRTASLTTRTKTSRIGVSRFRH